MEANYKHFVITLFNLSLWKKDKQNQPTRTDKYLKKRFELFEFYCLPSLKHQSCKDFIWLCLFDTNTPLIYKEKIEHYKQICPQFNPCFLTKEETQKLFTADQETQSPLISYIKPHIDEKTEYILTTNLDNDDVFLCDAIRCIQQKFSECKVQGIYSMNIGLQYFPRYNAILKMKYPHNHFLTLAENVQNKIYTIERYPHTIARKKFQVIDIFENPYWIEVVHDCNVNNDLRITSRIQYSFIWEPFSLKDKGIEIEINSPTSAYLQMIPYFFRIAIWRLKRKWQKFKNKKQETV
ncbi:MAG: hypothetical protein IJY36_03615 [Coprobacter sp.]|nr:hypothetical protein [Coprobacter sp.]